MLKMPKGIEYWDTDKKTGENIIKDDAPKWAKEEFKEYMNPPVEDDNGVITQQQKALCYDAGCFFDAQKRYCE